MATPVPNVNLHESEQDVTLKATIPFAVIAVISVVCRFIARRIQKLNFEFDDYMIVAGLIFTLGCFALSMEMVHFGSGKHLAAVPLSNIPQYFKVAFLVTEVSVYSTLISDFKLVPLRLRIPLQHLPLGDQAVRPLFLPQDLLNCQV